MGKLVRLGAADLREGELRGYETGEGRLVCLARIGGRYRAIDDWCNHAGCLISAGWIDPTPGGGSMAVCPCHEIGFDLDTGKNVTSPRICGDQQAIPVVEREGEIWAELPED